jgi:hypothetical protein
MAELLLVADIDRANDSSKSAADGKPQARRWTPALRHRDVHAGLWVGVIVLAAAIVVVIAFTALILRGQAR